MSDVALLVVAGFVMGFVGSIPPTGPVALMVITRVFKGRTRYALAAGIGGALAEMVYAALAITGVGLLIQQINFAETLIRAMSTFVLLGVGVYFFISPVRRSDIEQAKEHEADGLSTALEDMGKAFSISIVNPTIMLNWMAAVALLLTLFSVEAALVEQLSFAVFVAVGMSTWTVLEVWLLDKFQERVSVDVLGTIQRAVSVVVMLAALYLGYQTLAGL
jgi:threonine/homoserine/homoserine lactone efflux protein